MLRTTLALLLALTIGCSDNALRLRTMVETGVRGMVADGARSRVIRYTPERNPANPYWLILVPATRGATAADFVAKGVPSAEAEWIVSELAYLKSDLSRMVIIAQDGERLAFQRYHGRTTVIVDELMIIRATGPTELTLSRESDGIHLRRG